MKKVAISTNAGEVFAHFGRAPEFTIITFDEEQNKIINKEIFPNPGHTVGSIPQFINEKGAKYMISGGMGHRAQAFFNQYGIEVIVGITGSVDEVIRKILDGTLEGGESLCSPGAGKGMGVEKIHTEADDNYRNHHH